MELFSSPGKATYNRGAFLKEPVQFFNLKLPPSLFARHDRFYIFTHQAIEACIAIDSNLLGTLQHIVVNGYGYVCHYTLSRVTHNVIFHVLHVLLKNGRREVDRIVAQQPWVTLTPGPLSVWTPRHDIRVTNETRSKRASKLKIVFAS